MATSALAKYITESLKPWAYLYTKASHKNNDNNGPVPASALTACPLWAPPTHMRLLGRRSLMLGLPAAGSGWGRAAHAAEEAQKRATEMCSRGWQTGTSWDVRPSWEQGQCQGPMLQPQLHLVVGRANLTRSCLRLRIPALISQQPHVFNTVILTISYTGGPQSRGQHGNPDWGQREATRGRWENGLHPAPEASGAASEEQP